MRVLARLEGDQAANEMRERQETGAAAGLEIERTPAVLDQRALRSPIEGVVVDRLAERGTFLDRQPIFRRARLDPLHIEVIAPDSAFGSMRPGESLEVTLQSIVGAMVQAVVSAIDPFVDAASGTFRIRLDLPNPKAAIPAGFLCSLNLRG